MSKRWFAGAGLVLLVVFAIFMIGYSFSNAITGFGLFDKISFKIDGVQVGKQVTTSNLQTGQCRDYDGGKNDKRGSYTLVPGKDGFSAKGDFCKNKNVLVEQTCTNNKQTSVEIDGSKQKKQCTLNEEGLAFLIKPTNPKSRIQMHNNIIKAIDGACSDAEKLFGPIKTEEYSDSRIGYPIDLCKEKLIQRYYEAFSAGDYENANNILLRIHYFFLGSSKDTARIADWVLAKFYTKLFTDPKLNKLAGVRNTLQIAVYNADLMPDGFVKRIMVRGGVSQQTKGAAGKVTGKTTEEITGAFHWRGHDPIAERNNIFLTASLIYPRNQGLKVWNPDNDGLATINLRRGLIINEDYSIESSRCGENGAMTCATDYLIDFNYGSFNGCTLKGAAGFDFTCPDEDICSRERNQVSTTKKIESDLIDSLGAGAPTEDGYYRNTCEPHNRRSGRDAGDEGPGSLIPFSPYTFAGLCMPPANSVVTNLGRILSCSESLENIARESEYSNPLCPGNAAAEGESGGEGGDPCAGVSCSSGEFCNPTTGSCEPTSSSPCPENTCPDGTTCGAGGYCYPERTDVGFGDDVVEGEIGDESEDPCAGVVCPAGQTCEGGSCVGDRGASASEEEEPWLGPEDWSPEEEDSIESGLTNLEYNLEEATREERHERIAHCVDSSGMCPGCSSSDVSNAINRVSAAASNYVGTFGEGSLNPISSQTSITITVRLQRAREFSASMSTDYVELSGVHVPAGEYRISLSSLLGVGGGVESNTVVHELLHIIFHELGIIQTMSNNFAHDIIRCIEGANAVLPGTVDIPDYIGGPIGSCSAMDEFIQQCSDEPADTSYTDPLTPLIQCANMPGGGCDPVAGELQPTLSCLASQDSATRTFTAIFFTASRPGPDCQNDNCCNLDFTGTRCIDTNDAGVELGEFTASLIGCGPDMTPVDSNLCSQPLCDEGEEPEEDGAGGITCVPGGSNPPPDT